MTTKSTNKPAKTYRALKTPIKFAFQEHSSAVPGVTEYNAYHNGEFWFANIGAPAVIRTTNGQLYIADEILRNIGWNNFATPELRYGPSGRRHYVRLTDTIIDQISSAHGVMRNDRERARAIEVAAFADALIGLL